MIIVLVILVLLLSATGFALTIISEKDVKEIRKSLLVGKYSTVVDPATPKSESLSIAKLEECYVVLENEIVKIKETISALKTNEYVNSPLIEGKPSQLRDQDSDFLIWYNRQKIDVASSLSDVTNKLLELQN